ncbi:MAG TPA: phospholipase D-like domain-containing protein [Kofleriaceae bacterium]|nr:phospholipase D-like domain-containing protein [Kofleriaceae bacterium]
MTKLVVFASLAAILGCASDPAVDDSDPVLDGKDDGASTAILKGVLDWSGSAQDVAFDDDSGHGVELVYYTFALSGSATVTVETSAAPGDSADKNLDTVLYLYQPTGDTWGAYLVKNDDGGAGKFSKLSSTLGAGTYRVLVKRKTKTGVAHAALTASCSGAGCAPVQVGCTPLSPRSVTPSVFVGPDSWEASIEQQIDAARSSLDVQMYLFTVTDIANHIIAAQQRGVAVRVLLDSSEMPNNTTVMNDLSAAGVSNHLDPTVFSFAHAKYMIVDKATAVILSGNFNVGAVTTTGGGERNYGVIDQDAKDVADLQSIYESDWVAGPEPDLSCTRLIVSPINSEQRILDHVNSATKTLDIEVLYLDQTDIRAAVVAAAQRGVAVRILLSDPAKNPQNTATEQYFNGMGIPTKILLANYLHTKMIQADGVALVGSENMSDTSLTKNREVGELIFETAPAAQIHAQYELDWAAGQ